MVHADLSEGGDDPAIPGHAEGLAPIRTAMKLLDFTGTFAAEEEVDFSGELGGQKHLSGIGEGHRLGFRAFREETRFFGQVSDPILFGPEEGGTLGAMHEGPHDIPVFIEGPRVDSGDAEGTEIDDLVTRDGNFQQGLAGNPGEEAQKHGGSENPPESSAHHARIVF